MNNKRNSTVIIFLIMLTAALLSGCRYSIRYSSGSGNNFLKREDAKEYIVKKTAIQPISSIEINTRIADIELITADDYYIEIDYLYWDDEPRYKLEDGKLTFNDDKTMPNSYSLDFKLENVVRVYLPQDAQLDRIYLNSSSGNIKIEGFIAQSLKANSSYGNLTLKECAAARAVIKLASGNSTITDFQTGDLDYNNSYGHARFKNINIGDSKLPADISPDTLDISMSSGNADFDNVYINSLEIDNSYGNIDCDRITVDSFKAKLSSGNLNIEECEIRKLDISNSYGDVNIELLGKENDYSFDLDTSYGKIKVNNTSYDDHLVKDNDATGSISATLSSGNVTVTFRDK